MNIKRLIESLDDCRIEGPLAGFEVKGLACDSSSVKDGFIFVAIKGTHEDGHRFIDEAIDRGAGAVVACSSWFVSGRSAKIPVILVKDTRNALAKLAAQFYGRPSDKLKFIGVTGTNGKTTVTYLLEAILKEAGFNPGVIGTVNYRFNKKVIPSKNTTPGPLELQEMFSMMSKDGCDYVAMEVSSHALDQARTEGINFNSAIFTNLTQDHLDYHRNIDEYFQAKLRLFKGLPLDAYAVINKDDKYAVTIPGFTRAKIVTYAIDSSADIMAKDIKFDIKSTDFRVLGLGEDFRIRSKLIGKHNVYNMLAAIGWALPAGIAAAVIKPALEGFSCVPGRMELASFTNSFSVFVDYAHTDDALFNVIKSLRQISSGKIIVVFGCGGDRDKSKRPKMGRVVTELADYAFITSDNPRSEDPRDIIDDIISGIAKNNYCVVPDRAEAIKQSLAIAGIGDVVLIAGKGHENYQIIRGRKKHFDDREVVRECLRQ